VRRILPQFGPQIFPKKTPNKMTSKNQKNDYISFHVGRIFLNQGTSSTISPFLPKFPLTFPKKTKNRHDLQEKNKKYKETSALSFLVPFL